MPDGYSDTSVSRGSVLNAKLTKCLDTVETALRWSYASKRIDAAAKRALALSSVEGSMTAPLLEARDLNTGSRNAREYFVELSLSVKHGAELAREMSVRSPDELLVLAGASASVAFDDHARAASKQIAPSKMAQRLGSANPEIVEVVLRTATAFYELRNLAAGDRELLVRDNFEQASVSFVAAAAAGLFSDSTTGFAPSKMERDAVGTISKLFPPRARMGVSYGIDVSESF